MFYFEYIQLPRGLKMISNSLPLLNYPLIWVLTAFPSLSVFFWIIVILPYLDDDWWITLASNCLTICSGSLGTCTYVRTDAIQWHSQTWTSVSAYTVRKKLICWGNCCKGEWNEFVLFLPSIMHFLDFRG